MLCKVDIVVPCIYIDKRASLACAARLADTVSARGVLGCLGSH